MDKQARKLNTPKEDGAENGEEHASNEDSDHDEKVSLFLWLLFSCVFAYMCSGKVKLLHLL